MSVVVVVVQSKTDVALILRERCFEAVTRPAVMVDGSFATPLYYVYVSASGWPSLVSILSDESEVVGFDTVWPLLDEVEL